MTRTLRTMDQATRLRLKTGLDLADHAADLLYNKEEALQRERTRLEGQVSRTEQRWHSLLADATAWLLRARALGAATELAALSADPPTPATVDIRWRTAMGVTYPGEVDCTAVPPADFTSTAALIPARDCYHDALTAGAEHAAASAALRRVEAELLDTRRRRRAIELRLQPRRRAELQLVDLHLDEQDRDEALRTQLAARHGSTTR